VNSCDPIADYRNNTAHPGTIGVLKSTAIFRVVSTARLLLCLPGLRIDRYGLALDIVFEFTRHAIESLLLVLADERQKNAAEPSRKSFAVGEFDSLPANILQFKGVFVNVARSGCFPLQAGMGLHDRDDRLELGISFTFEPLQREQNRATQLK